MSYYLTLAIGFYLGAALVNKGSFKDADAKSIYLGIIAALFFPITIVMMLFGDETQDGGAE